MLTDLSPRVVTAWDGQQAFRHGRALSPAERYDVTAAIEALDADIASPLRVETAVQCSRRLGTMGAGADFDEDAFVDALIVALPGTPDAALEEASRRILAGEVKGISKAFMPKTAEVVALAREIVDGWTIRRARLAELLDMPERDPDPAQASFTPERMAKMQAMSARLVAAAAKVGESRPMTPGRSAGARVAADIARRRAEATEQDPENDTAAQRRSSLDGGAEGRLVESVPKSERYDGTAISSSLAGKAGS